MYISTTQQSTLQLHTVTMASFLILLLFFFYSINGTLALFPSSSSHSSVKAAYWPSWASSSFPPSSIDTSLFTHIFYAFLNPQNTTFKLVPSQSQAILLSNFTSTLHHSKHPPVKTILSIGGGGADPTIFAAMASTPSSRRSFIASTIEVARTHDFDGLDLDWEFPADPKEMQDLAQLLREWRSAVQREAKLTRRPPLLLTSAVYFANHFFLSGARRAYPAASITKNLDWVSPMCFDYHGSWDTSATGAHAALFDPKSNISTSYGLGSWIEAGVPVKKLVMGMPLYGRTWKLKDRQNHGVGAEAVGLGPGDNGVLTFSEIWDFNKKSGATVVYDNVTVSTYSYAGEDWIGYDDRRSVRKKVEFARGLGLRGYFFWAVHGDKNFWISKQASKAWGR